LAYLTAKTNGLEEEAAEILEAAGLTEVDVDDVPSYGQSTLKLPPIITSTHNMNWPVISGAESFWDRALANGHLDTDGEIPYANGIDGSGAILSSALDDWAKEEGTQDAIDPEEGGWELDAAGGETEDQEEEFEDAIGEEDSLGAGATTGVSENDLWVRNSPFAADHVAAGSFETAMQVSISFQVRLLSVDPLGSVCIVTQSPVWRHFLCSSQTPLSINLPIISRISISTAIHTTPSTTRPPQYI